MKIRTQNVLAIVPLFVGLAAITGLVTYTSARQQLLWGVREEAAALAVTAAEFIDGDSLRAALAAPPGGAPYLRALGERLERVHGFGQARRLFLLTADGGRRVLGAGPAAPLPERSPALLAAVRRDETYLDEARVRDPRGASLTAFSPVRDGAGRLAGILGVETDAGSVAARSRSILREVLLRTLVVALLGTLAALFLAYLLRSRVRDLTRAAALVAAGDYQRQIQIQTIREVSDLANTFNTMSSVLRDLLRKTRHELVEAEQYRTEDDLAATLRAGLFPPLSARLGGLQVAGRGLAGAPTGDFLEAGEAGGLCHACIGRIAGESRLDASVAAAAARDFLRARLRDDAPEEAARLLADAFDLASLELARWREGEGTLALLSVRGGEATTRVVELAPAEPLLLHTLPEADAAALAGHLLLFRGAPPAELLEQLAAALGPRVAGSLLLVGHP